MAFVNRTSWKIVLTSLCPRDCVTCETCTQTPMSIHMQHRYTSLFGLNCAPIRNFLLDFCEHFGCFQSIATYCTFTNVSTRWLAIQLYPTIWLLLRPSTHQFIAVVNWSQVSPYYLPWFSPSPSFWHLKFFYSTYSTLSRHFWCFIDPEKLNTSFAPSLSYYEVTAWLQLNKKVLGTLYNPNFDLELLFNCIK